MRKTIAVLGLAALVGCANLATNLFRTEQTATQAAYAAYVVYTNGLANGSIVVSANESNQIKSVRLKVAASVLTVETWRQAYQTNSAFQSQAQAALTALLEDSSNLVYLVNLVRSK